MKPTVYVKQPNEPPTPVTVRIDWLPSGKIKPIMYWTPDNSCYEIKYICESTLLAFLKEKGVGIRFKVIAELEPYFRHEIYLYFCDNRFCEKGFIDQRYSHPCKEYIPVTMDVFPNADYELVSFNVGSNRYVIEETLEIKPKASLQAGGIGVCHKVNAHLATGECRQAALYWELDKWFVAKA